MDALASVCNEETRLHVASLLQYSSVWLVVLCPLNGQATIMLVLRRS
jgi:hypothetical protein